MGPFHGSLTPRPNRAMAAVPDRPVVPALSGPPGVVSCCRFEDDELTTAATKNAWLAVGAKANWALLPANILHRAATARSTNDPLVPITAWLLPGLTAMATA